MEEFFNEQTEHYVKYKNFSVHHATDITPHKKNFYMHYENGYEIYLFIKGNGEYIIEGNKYSLEPYVLLIMNDKELHMLNISEDEPYQRIVLSISRDFVAPFLSSGIDFFSAFKFRKLGQGNMVSADLVKKNNIIVHFERLLEICATKDAESEVVAQCIIIEILSTINHIYLNNITALPNSANTKMNEILNFINSNLSEHLCLDLIAEKFFLSKYHLSHIFKKTTGFTVSKYITYKRIFLANSLMSNGYTPTQVCFMSGFNDYSNFYKSYRALTGKSPKNH